MYIKAALQMAGAQLAERVGEAGNPLLEAELLLSHVLKKDRSWLHAWPEHELGGQLVDEFRLLCKLRQEGQPLAYLLGERSFWAFDLEVGPGVLIPRPETELLVELLLDKLDEAPKLVADLGTGSGAIALALAWERPDWQLLATDSSDEALGYARRNAVRLGLKNITFAHGSWCAALPGVFFDALVSNPPYIAAGDEHLQQGDLRYEPQSALIAADQGLADIRQIAEQARTRLRPGAWLLLEHGYRQGAEVRAILAGLAYHEVETHRDLAGHERLTCGRRTLDDA